MVGMARLQVGDLAAGEGGAGERRTATGAGNLPALLGRTTVLLAVLSAALYVIFRPMVSGGCTVVCSFIAPAVVAGYATVLAGIGQRHRWPSRPERATWVAALVGPPAGALVSGKASPWICARLCACGHLGGQPCYAWFAALLMSAVACACAACLLQPDPDESAGARYPGA